MEFAAQRKDLLASLQTVIGVVERRQTMPILSNVLIQSDNNQLTITATDLEIELVTQCPAVISTPGEMTVPARKLLDICRGLPDDAEIKCSQDGSQTKLSAGRSRFTLASLAAQDWPHLDEVEQGQAIDVSERTLKELLDRTHFAMAHQDVRYYLNGLLLDLRSDRIRTVATDGHRLALSESANELDLDEPRQAIIPRKAIVELVRLLESSEASVRIWLSNKHLRLRLAGLNFTTKLIDGRFPDYERVIPENPERRMTAHRETLRQALARTAILSNEKFRGVRLSLAEHSLTLRAQNVDREEAEDHIEVNYTHEPMEIGFNVGYLMDALGAITEDEFELALSGPDSSGLIQGIGNTESRYVVMPMRL